MPEGERGMEIIATAREQRKAYRTERLHSGVARQGAVRLVRSRFLLKPLVLLDFKKVPFWPLCDGQQLSCFCVGLLPFRHSFFAARGLTFRYEGLGFRAGAVLVAAWRGTRAGGRSSAARGRSDSAEQLLSGFAADKLGRRLYRPQRRLWPRTKQLDRLVGLNRQ